MNPESLSDKLKEALEDRLESVVLYGSAASGDHSERYSDYNVLVVCSRLGHAELDAIEPLTRSWAKAGNPPPLMFTRERLMQSSDVFPIELMDIKESHRILFGEDLLKTLPINQTNLRFQLEHELKGKLIQLRESYLLTGGKDKEILELMVRSLSTFQVLLRAMVRFFDVNVPTQKSKAIDRLSKHVKFDLSVFETLQQLKNGALNSEDLDVRNLFGQYLSAVEDAADLVNELERKGNR
ncbi:nucleotidyltransferase domain-containing protein [Puniceicoccaceae bacterium K14]|nr:nucleotidyltransferase domain-containing protein [Puniceicoccaceae bacterium K14]